MGCGVFLACVIFDSMSRFGFWASKTAAARQGQNNAALIISASTIIIITTISIIVVLLPSSPSLLLLSRLLLVLDMGCTDVCTTGGICRVSSYPGSYLLRFCYIFATPNAGKLLNTENPKEP